MIAPADLPPHPTKGKILFDGYHNTLIWENTRVGLTPEESAEAAYRKSIAFYAAPWNPAVGQKWLDLKTNLVMVHRGLPYWCYDDEPLGSSAIPIDFYNFSLNAYQTAQSPPPYPTGAELQNTTKPKPKPLPQEAEPPKKSRVFTLK